MLLMAVVWLGVLLALLGYVGQRLIGPTELSRRARLGAWLALVGVLVLNVASRALGSEERRVGKECRSRWSPYH